MQHSETFNRNSKYESRVKTTVGDSGFWIGSIWKYCRVFACSKKYGQTVIHSVVATTIDGTDTRDCIIVGWSLSLLRFGMINIMLTAWLVDGCRSRMRACCRCLCNVHLPWVSVPNLVVRDQRWWHKLGVSKNWQYVGPVLVMGAWRIPINTPIPDMGRLSEFGRCMVKRYGRWSQKFERYGPISLLVCLLSTLFTT